MVNLSHDEQQAVRSAFGNVQVSQLIRCRPGMKEIQIPLLPPHWGRYEYITMQASGQYIVCYGQQTHVLVIGKPDERY